MPDVHWEASLNALTTKGSTGFVGLESFQNPGVQTSGFDSLELVCSCPITGQPDLYAVHIWCNPDEKCLESKSLKLYLHNFKDDAMFAESLAVKICDDVFECLEPFECHVTLKQAIRGGIALTATASRERE